VPPPKESPRLDHSTQQGTTSVETGIKILMQLSQECQQKYSKLVSRPLLIVENLLMDEKIEGASKILDFIESLRVRTFYAFL